MTAKKQSTTRGTEKDFNTRTSLKQKFQDYRTNAMSYISTLRFPKTSPAFYIKGYDVTPTGKKPNALSAPELLAIVSTAAKLGKTVTVTVSGSGEAAQVEFHFVDSTPAIPSALYF